MTHYKLCQGALLLVKRKEAFSAKNVDSDHPRGIIEKNFTTEIIHRIDQRNHCMNHNYESFQIMSHYTLFIFSNSRNEIDFDGRVFFGIGRLQAEAKNDQGKSYYLTHIV